MQNNTRCLFRKNLETSSEGEIWTQLFHVKAGDIDTLTKRYLTEGYITYQSISFETGNTTIYPFLFIDIDHSDLSQSQASAIKLLKYFQSLGISDKNFSISFSGSKGFHILLDNRLIFDGAYPTSRDFPPNLQKKFAEEISKQCLSSDDAKPDPKIYTRNRLIRSFYSKNVKSGLYKIPLSETDLSLPIEKITERAKDRTLVFPSHFDSTLSFFVNVPDPNPILKKIYTDQRKIWDEETNVQREVGKKKKGSESKKSPEESKKLLGSSQKVITSCRAIRGLVRKISETGEASGTERGAVAMALAETDSRSSLIHRYLSRSKGYDRSTTETKMRSLNISTSCDDLIKDGICQKKCDRYLTASGKQSITPSYFSYAVREQNWWNNTSVEYIKEVAHRLKEYHETTTDLFDWVNCEQFLRFPEILGAAISDNVRKGYTPELDDDIIFVQKDDGRQRLLIRTAFESELISSLFVDSGLLSNRLFRESTRSPHVFSFGYLEKDDTKEALIRPWSVEYGSYKSALSSLSSSDDFPLVYSDDIRDFYPSIKRPIVQRLLREMYPDERISLVLESLIYSPKRNFSNGEKADSDQGLPQGPLICHIIAARLLLEIDDYISRAFSEHEIKVVRYCDDFVFLCKNQEIRERLISVVLPEIERKYGITFHKDINSRKTYSSDVQEYRTNRLEADLYKYQLKFETELARSSEEDKKDFLSLLTALFGATLERYLSSDQQLNKKELERNIAAIRWRISDSLSGGIEYAELIESLGSKILIFLGKEEISFKLRSNLAVLLFSLIDANESSRTSLLSGIAGLMEKSSLHSISKVCIWLQLIRYLAVNRDSKIPIHYSQKLKSALEKHGNYGEKKLKAELEFLSTNDQAVRELDNFNFGLWLQKEIGVQRNASSLLAKYLSSRRSATQIVSLVLESDSEASFYIACNRIDLISNKEIYSSKDRYLLFNLYRDLGLSEVEQMFFEDFKSFANLNLLTERDKSDLDNSLSYVRRAISDLFGDDGTPILVKNIGGRNIFAINSNTYVFESQQLSRFRGISNNKILSVCSKISSISSIGDLRARISSESSSVELISKIGSGSPVSIKKYLDSANSLGVLVEADAPGFWKVDQC